MLLHLLQQFKVFSRVNWWIYILLSCIVVFVYFTSTWNAFEIFIFFLLNLLWALFMMMMQDSYKDYNFSIGSIFLLFANIIYWWISLYWFLVNNEVQYLLWQISFNLSWIQLLLKDVWWITIRWINFYTIFPLWIIIISILVLYYHISFYWLIQSLWFLSVSSWLVIANNIKRYYALFLWTFLIVSGSFIGIAANYLSWDILWITVGYWLLWTVTLIYYIQTFPKYYYTKL